MVFIRLCIHTFFQKELKSLVWSRRWALTGSPHRSLSGLKSNPKFTSNGLMKLFFFELALVPCVLVNVGSLMSTYNACQNMVQFHNCGITQHSHPRGIHAGHSSASLLETSWCLILFIFFSFFVSWRQNNLQKLFNVKDMKMIISFDCCIVAIAMKFGNFDW